MERGAGAHVFPAQFLSIFVTSAFILFPTVSIFFPGMHCVHGKNSRKKILLYASSLHCTSVFDAKKPFSPSKVSQKKCGVNAVVLPPQNHLRRRRCHRGKRKLLQQQLLPQAGRAFFNLCISLHRLPPPTWGEEGKT